MGLRSFMASDEPLSAGRLKLSDRLCEELEIKSLMRSSPLTNNNTYSKAPPLANGSSKHYEYGESVSSRNYFYAMIGEQEKGRNLLENSIGA